MADVSFSKNAAGEAGRGGSSDCRIAPAMAARRERWLGISTIIAFIVFGKSSIGSA